MPFTIRDIPAAMRSNGWMVGAQVMDRWFNRAARTMTGDEKIGKIAPHDVEARMVTMPWAMRFSRVKTARDHLVGSWHQSPRLAATTKILGDRLRVARQERADHTPFRFGNLGAATAIIDATCQVNIEPVSSAMFGPIDDFYAAIGSGLVKLAISGMAAPVGTARWRVTIDEIGIYLRDTYDFNGDQPLGSWGPDGMSRLAILAPEIPIIAELPHSDGRGRYFSVDNGSFRKYRAHYKQGGDFVIFSDVSRQRLATPIVIEVAA